MVGSSVEQQLTKVFDLLLRPRAEQTTAIRGWLAAHRTRQLDLRSQLVQSKLDNEANIDQEVTAVDAVLAGSDV